MEYLIRLAQWHESFRVAELKAVATVIGADIKIISYEDAVCDPLRCDYMQVQLKPRKLCIHFF